MEKLGMDNLLVDLIVWVIKTFKKLFVRGRN